MVVEIVVVGAKNNLNGVTVFVSRILRGHLGRIVRQRNTLNFKIFLFDTFDVVVAVVVLILQRHNRIFSSGRSLYNLRTMKMQVKVLPVHAPVEVLPREVFQRDAAILPRDYRQGTYSNP